MNLVVAAFVCVLLAFTAVCLVLDIRIGRIPNWLTVSFFGLGVAAHSIAHGLSGLQFSLLGFATGFGLLFILFAIGGSGGGDVKLMGALGAWLGVKLTLAVFLVSAIATPLLLAFVALGGNPVAGLLRGVRGQEAAEKANRPEAKARSGQRLPYGVSIAISTWIVLAYSWKTNLLYEILCE